jgi:DNA-binding CsgD family transcriptional regulator
MLARWADTVPASPLGQAWAARSRALIAAARGDWTESLAALAAALGAHDRVEAPFERARTLLVMGRVQRHARRRRDARASLESAALLFERQGARLWLQQARREMERIGGRGPADAGLTPSERRFADLVAAGRTNKEVAAVLTVRERTVESALTQIYRKLEVRSRVGLARKLAGLD